MWLITVWDTPNVFATERVSSMSLFETFVQTELPQRAVMLTDYNTGGYTGNPNSATLDKIKFAPVGTWFLDSSSGDLWQKLIQTDPSSWLLRVGGGSAVSRKTALLGGTVDGDNRVFSFPEAVQHDYNSSTPTNGVVQVMLYHATGRRIHPDDFEIYESNPGVSGKDRVRLLRFAPHRVSLLADYVPA
jgi:hypothetical protein